MLVLEAAEQIVDGRALQVELGPVAGEAFQRSMQADDSHRGRTLRPRAERKLIAHREGWPRKREISWLSRPGSAEDPVATLARPEALQAGLRESIASFAVPSIWRLQSEPLPVNQTGKIDKPSLLARLSAHERAFAR